MLSKTRIEQAFKMFDQVKKIFLFIKKFVYLCNKFWLFMKDGNGFISKNELESIMGGIELEESQWKQIMKECDSNGDGMVCQKN